MRKIELVDLAENERHFHWSWDSWATVTPVMPTCRNWKSWV